MWTNSSSRATRYRYTAYESAPAVVAMSARAHQRSQSGERIVKSTAAGCALTIPSEFTARTVNRYRPGARLAYVTVRCSSGRAPVRVGPLQQVLISQDFTGPEAEAHEIDL